MWGEHPWKLPRLSERPVQVAAKIKAGKRFDINLLDRVILVLDAAEDLRVQWSALG